MIRHAASLTQEIFGQRATATLTSEGKAEATRLARRLREAPLAAIYSSPLARAVQTARMIGAGRNIPVICDAALGEIAAGEWDGCTFQDLSKQELWMRFNSFRSMTRCPGGEAAIEVQARLMRLFERLRGEHEGATVACVSHAEAIRAAVCFALGAPLDLSPRLRIDTASVSTLRIWPDWIEVSNVNEKDPVSPP